MQISTHGYMKYCTACEGKQFSTVGKQWNIEKLLGNVKVYDMHMLAWVCVFIVCIWSQSKREYCLGVYLQRQTVSEASPGAMLHHRCITLPTQVASYPKVGLKWDHTILLQCGCTIYTFPQFGWDSRSLGKWKKSSTCLNQDRTLHTNAIARVLQVFQNTGLIFQK